MSLQGSKSHAFISLPGFSFFSVGDQECLILCTHILPSGTGDGNLTEAETLLQPYTEKFPNVSNVFVLFFSSDMILMKYVTHFCSFQRYFELNYLYVVHIGSSDALLHCEDCFAQRKLHLCEYSQ